jgi:outer membrane receptor protein involved in Fe transport
MTYKAATANGAALAIIMAFSPTLGRAQQAPASSDQSTTALGEVVVTATRRSESVLKVPYNITAISGRDLQDRGITSLADLGNQVIGLQEANYGERGANLNDNFVIRGITTNDIGVGESEFPNLAGSTVSNYIDDVPLFINLKLTDIDRVEVLRGPQGTLFGADSEGGTVRTIHNKPDPGGFDAWIDASVSGTVRADRPNGSLDAMINLPITPRLALRIDAGYENLAGYIDADNAVRYNQSGSFLPMTAQPLLANPSQPLTSPYVTGDLHDINYSNLWYGRADLLWKATDHFTAEVTYQRQQSYANAFSMEYPGSDYVTRRLIPINPSQTNTDIGSVTLTGDFGFGTITSATSYYNVDTHDLYDNSGIDVELPYYYGAYPRITTPNYDFNRDDGFTEEVRLVSPVGKYFDYVVGVYYMDRADEAYSVETVPGFAQWANLPGSSSAGFPTYADQIVSYYNGTRPGTLNPPDLTYDFLRKVRYTDLAAFSELTGHVTSRLRITGGARLFRETFSQSTIQHIYSAGTDFGSDSLGTSEGAGAKTSFDAIFKANVSYDVAPHTLAYFTFSQGYRPGGANAYPIGTCVFCNDASLATFGPDRTNNYELGLKGATGVLQYTVDVFEIDWQNVQQEVTSTAGTPIIINGQGARSRGVELEAHYAITRHLRLSGGYAFTDAKLTDDFSVDGGNYTGASGTPLPGVSRHQVNLALDYSARLFQTHDVDFHIDGSYRSEFNNQIETTLPNFVQISGYSLFNAYIQTKVNEHATLTLFAHNLFNAKGITAASSLPPGGPPGDYPEAESFEKEEFVTQPLTVGLRVVVRR